MANDESKQALADQFGLHPIAVEASSLARKKADGTVYFDARAQNILRAALEELRESTELRDAINSLIHVAGHLKYELGQPQAGHELLAVAETAAMALQVQHARQAEKVQDFAEEALQRIARFKGEVHRTRAPHVEDRVPVGSMKVVAFNPPMRC